jgi:hypothetical protein
MKNLLFIPALLLFSCAPEMDESISIEQGKPTTAATGFLKWYKKHYKLLNPLALGNYRLTDTTTMFVIDTVRTSAYLQLFRESDYVTTHYTEKREEYFRKAIRRFRRDMHVEEPDGFDHDFVLFTQEIESALDAIDHPKVLSEAITGNNATVKVDLTGACVYLYLVKTLKGWQIDHIENAGMN